MEKKELAIAIPASIIADTPHLREKTSKIGLVGRASAIFKVKEIIVYSDNPKVDQAKDLKLISTLLAYMETPQYLRKKLFKLSPDLRYAGILPPLRTPHHPLSGEAKNLKLGEYREGLIISKTKQGLLVDVGVEQPAIMFDKQFASRQRITSQVVKVGGQIEVRVANREEIPIYWGYFVTLEHSLLAALEDRRFDLRIATSKFGSAINNALKELTERWETANRILVLFGAPTRGLYEIAREERINLNEKVDFVLNTVPAQGTETVRTEEALLASLAIFSFQFGV